MNHQYTLELRDAGPDEDKVIDVLETVGGFTHEQAVSMVKDLPCYVMHNAPPREIDVLESALKEANATVYGFDQFYSNRRYQISLDNVNGNEMAAADVLEVYGLFDTAEELRAHPEGSRILFENVDEQTADEMKYDLERVGAEVTMTVLEDC